MLQAQIVLQHLLFCPSFLRSVVGKAEKYRVFSDHPELEFIWESIRSHADRYGVTPGKTLLLSDIQKRLASSPSGGDEESFRRMIDTLYCFTSRDHNEAFCVDWMSDIIRIRIRERINKTLEDNEEDPEEFAEELEKLAREYGCPSSGGMVLENPFNDLDYYLRDAAEVIPTGVGWLDHMLEGGCRRGEMGLWIIPQKSGKTMLGVQIGSEQARMGNYFYHGSTEQILKDDVTKRFVVRASGWTATNWVKVKWNIHSKDVPQQVKQQLATVVPLWKKYWQFCELKNPNLKLASMADFFAQLHELKERDGFDPIYILIDWWGRWRDRMNDEHMLRHPMTSDMELRRLFRTWLQQAKDHTEKHNKILLVLHQLAGAEAAKGTNHLSSVYSAQEDKNISQAFDFAFVSSKAELKSKDVVHQMDIARTRGNLKIALHLDWDHCQIVPKKNSYSASLVKDIDDAPEATSAALTSPFDGHV